MQLKERALIMANARRLIKNTKPCVIPCFILSYLELEVALQDVFVEMLDLTLTEIKRHLTK